MPEKETACPSKDIGRSKAVRVTCRVILLVLTVAVLGFIGKTLWDWRVVGEVRGTQLYYNDAVYTECSIQPDADIGDCLGAVQQVGSDARSKIYTIKNHPDYIFLRLGLIGERTYQRQEPSP